MTTINEFEVTTPKVMVMKLEQPELIQCDIEFHTFLADGNSITLIHHTELFKPSPNSLHLGIQKWHSHMLGGSPAIMARKSNYCLGKYTIRINNTEHNFHDIFPVSFESTADGNRVTTTALLTHHGYDTKEV